MKFLITCLITLFVFVAVQGSCQNVTIQARATSIESILRSIEKQTSYHVVYEKLDLLKTKKVTVQLNNVSVESVLKECLKDVPVSFKIIGQTIVLKEKETPPDPAPAKLAPSADINVQGVVMDEKEQKLPGANVVEKTTGRTVMTDLNGAFHLSVPGSGGALVISFIGMQTQEVPVVNRTVFNITLKREVADLSNVVVIGYGTQKKEDVNGAVSSVKAADIANVPQSSVDQLLQGKASGVYIAQNSGAPGSNTSVRIRGVTSLNGTNEPLYVIDGVPVSGDAANGSTSGRAAMQSSPGNANSQVTASPLALINPSDIESIDVLKDASATAIYGNRASNGVIIITTKRGKNGTARINYDGYWGQQRVGKYLNLMNLKQYATLQNSLADIYGLTRRTEFADISLLGEGTDWQRAIFKTADQQNHQLSVSGGKDGINYYLSGGYMQQKGIVTGSDFKRYTFRTNIDGQVKEWFRMGVSLTASHSKERVVVGENTGVIYNTFLQAPEVAVYNVDGTFGGPPDNPSAASGILNPVAQALQISNMLGRSNLNANLYSDLKFYKDLTLRSELGGDFNFSDNSTFNPTYSWGFFKNATATLSERNQRSAFFIWKEYLNYHRKFGQKHDLTAVLGYEVQQATWNGIEASRQGFYSNDVQSLNLGQASTATNDEYKGKQTQQSFYGRGIYTFYNRYSITATLRSDKSSKFADGHRVGYFPAFAASWRMSEEGFMKGITGWVNNAKLRLGYGQVGNQEIPNNLYSSALSASATGLGTGFLLNRIANPELTWQTAIQYNAGLDLGFLNNRIEASVDFYKKTSKNFLFQTTLPAFVVGGPAYLGGINPPYVNLGKVENNGFDITVNTKNIVGRDFKWNSTLILSHYTNVVKELTPGMDEIIGTITAAYIPVSVTRTAVGGAIGEFYGYKVKDIFRTTDQLNKAPVQFGRPLNNSSAGTWLGDVQYQDVDGNGVIDEKDRTAIGNPNPKFTYSVTNTFTYKIFDLSIFVNGVYGNKILSLIDRSLGSLATTYQNQLASYSGFWTPQNPGSNIPAPKSGLDNPNLNISDRFVKDGSYLRIQNVSLGCRLPSAWIKRVKLSSCKIYASVQNLHTFTHYDGLDPEIGAANQSAILNNIDIGRYPIARTVTIGINAQF